MMVRQHKQQKKSANNKAGNNACASRKLVGNEPHVKTKLVSRISGLRLTMFKPGMGGLHPT